MRKCPICKREKEIPLCPFCGFDERSGLPEISGIFHTSRKKKIKKRKLAFLIGEAPGKELRKLGPAGSWMQQFRKAGISCSGRVRSHY